MHLSDMRRAQRKREEREGTKKKKRDKGEVKNRRHPIQKGDGRDLRGLLACDILCVPEQRSKRGQQVSGRGEEGAGDEKRKQRRDQGFFPLYRGTKGRSGEQK